MRLVVSTLSVVRVVHSSKLVEWRIKLTDAYVGAPQGFGELCGSKRKKQRDVNKRQYTSKAFVSCAFLCAAYSLGMGLLAHRIYPYIGLATSLSDYAQVVGLPGRSQCEPSIDTKSPNISLCLKHQRSLKETKWEKGTLRCAVCLEVHESVSRPLILAQSRENSPRVSVCV